MRTLLSPIVPILLLFSLGTLNIQLASARQSCPTVNCGAGDFLDGGISGSCSSGQCWWASCLQRAGQCTTGNAQNCGYQIGCPNAPCTLQGSICNDTSECCQGYVCNQDQVCGTGSPIMINLKNNSSNYHLTSYQDGVWFDLQGTGEMLRVGWTEADSLVGILALDRNGNGTIDNGGELFGTATRMSNGQLARNGFEALLDFDGGPASATERSTSSMQTIPLFVCGLITTTTACRNRQSWYHWQASALWHCSRILLKSDGWIRTATRIATAARRQ
jgi:hypothetical protein